MEFRHLGDSGLVVSAVGLGTNNLGLKLDMDESREVVNAALDAGITLIDTADAYGLAEERLGELLQGRRDDIILATKFAGDVRWLGLDHGPDWGARASRRYVRKAVESSLRKLRTDWIDLYQYHQPDRGTPVEETLSVLDDLVHEGKVRYIGHSNFSGFLTADAHWTAKSNGYTRFVSDQSMYSLLERGAEKELFPALEKYGMGFLPYQPLAQGLLSGKYRRGSGAPAGSRLEVLKKEALLTDTSFDKIEALEAFAAEREISLLQLAIGWVSSRPIVSSVLVGATSPSQIAENLAASEWRPTAEDAELLDALTA